MTGRDHKHEIYRLCVTILGQGAVKKNETKALCLFTTVMKISKKESKQNPANSKGIKKTFHVTYSNFNNPRQASMCPFLDSTQIFK